MRYVRDCPVYHPLHWRPSQRRVQHLLGLGYAAEGGELILAAGKGLASTAKAGVHVQKLPAGFFLKKENVCYRADDGLLSISFLLYLNAVLVPSVAALSSLVLLQSLLLLLLSLVLLLLLLLLAAFCPRLTSTLTALA